eukprot:127616-Rhodomonas_salina.2
MADGDERVAQPELVCCTHSVGAVSRGRSPPRTGAPPRACSALQCPPPLPRRRYGCSFVWDGEAPLARAAVEALCCVLPVICIARRLGVQRAGVCNAILAVVPRGAVSGDWVARGTHTPSRAVLEIIAKLNSAIDCHRPRGQALRCGGVFAVILLQRVKQRAHHFLNKRQMRLLPRVGGTFDNPRKRAVFTIKKEQQSALVLSRCFEAQGPSSSIVVAPRRDAPQQDWEGHTGARHTRVCLYRPCVDDNHLFKARSGAVQADALHFLCGAQAKFIQLAWHGALEALAYAARTTLERRAGPAPPRVCVQRVGSRAPALRLVMAAHKKGRPANAPRDWRRQRRYSTP